MVGDIDLMKKGLRHASAPFVFSTQISVGDIDLMKKGLRWAEVLNDALREGGTADQVKASWPEADFD
jgi:hypothetical protein